jgi:hypothetical protein
VIHGLDGCIIVVTTKRSGTGGSWRAFARIENRGRRLANGDERTSGRGRKAAEDAVESHIKHGRRCD